VFLGEVRHGLQDLGYVEGEKIRLINTYAAERYDRFADNAAALVGQNVDLIVAVTRPAALAAQRATKSIPIVSVVVPDPVGSGLVASLARPGGNITAPVQHGGPTWHRPYLPLSDSSWKIRSSRSSSPARIAEIATREGFLRSCLLA
jgi:hypothetical protein